MKHLIRAGLILVLIILVVFFTPKVVPSVTILPTNFFHTSNTITNEKEWASLPITYAQSSVCLDCHRAPYRLWEQSNHKPVACENCHGPAKEHLESGLLPIVDKSRELCGTCHAKLNARPVDFPQVDMNEMGGQEPCTACHNPHDPRAGMPPKVPHSLDGRSECQSCHAPHEPLEQIPPKVPHTLLGRTDCLLCHGSPELKKAAPPLIPHTLVGRDDCLTCHNSGGIKPFPTDHAGRAGDQCQTCHLEKTG